MIKLLFALIAIAGYIANIKDKKELSYWLWSVSNVYWIIYNLNHNEFQLAFMFTVYAAFCFWGLIKTI